MEGSGAVQVRLSFRLPGKADYSLTAQITSERKAKATWLLYLLAPSPAILASLYTEPLFACLTFSGFGLVLRRRYYAASILLAGATSIRATGILAAPTLAAMAIFKDAKYRISPSVSLPFRQGPTAD
jgi:Gpi18-like mannosyltransferase